MYYEYSQFEIRLTGKFDYIFLNKLTLIEYLQG